MVTKAEFLVEAIPRNYLECKTVLEMKNLYRLGSRGCFNRFKHFGWF